jgi:gluconate 2-dehydrogenase gamma chain
MVSQSQWPTVPISPRDSDEKLFFTENEWDTVEAATARIIPTDHDPGAREADVVRFLDRFLSGTDFIYASARGDGFLKPSGKDAEAWESRIRHRQGVYREGIAAVDTLSKNKFNRDFVGLSETEQDEVLVETSGKPKPAPVQLSNDIKTNVGEGGPPPSNQPVNDQGMGFFEMLVTHTRQGFYADPVYGGNKNQIGWRVIGFDGPASLADTVDGTYTTVDYMIMKATWPYAQSAAVQAYHRSQPVTRH